jgi:hypothetical protein
MTSCNRTSCPETSSNNLKDVIDWLKLGDFVCIHAEKIGLSYCNVKTVDVKNMRVIYVDVSRTPSLLSEDEWPWYIKHHALDVVECKDEDDVRKHILENCPYIYHFTC